MLSMVMTPLVVTICFFIQMTDPSVMEAMRNPRVTEAFRQIQEGFTILRTEAPQLLKYLKQVYHYNSGIPAFSKLMDLVPQEPKISRTCLLGEQLPGTKIFNFYTLYS